jgi:hypothetical protein
MIRRTALATALLASLPAVDVHAVRPREPEALVAVDGYVEGEATVATGDGPRRRPGAVADLRLDGRSTRWLFVATLRARAGGPFEGAQPGLYNLVHAFQNRSPSLELTQAYAELHLPRARLRGGVQTFAWGQLDGPPPTDVLNPRDYHDPLADGPEETTIGIPALTGTYYPPDPAALDARGLRLTLAYVPFAVPPRLPLPAERWFPPSARPRSRVVIPKRLGDRASPPVGRLVVPVRTRTRNARPPLRLDAGGIGLRLGGAWRGASLNIYHYTGPESAPNAELSVEVVRDCLATLRPCRRGRVIEAHASSVLRQAHDVVHMTGADASGTIGGFTYRAEIAVFLDRPYQRSVDDLFSPTAIARLPIKRIGAQLRTRGRARIPVPEIFPERDAVEWGLGLDYLTHGFVPVLQVNQIALLEPGPRLLIGDPETRIVASLRKALLDERVVLDVRGLYAVERGGWFVFPQATCRLGEALGIRVGYLAIGGSRASVIGQFKENDEVILQARYAW